MTAMIGEEDPFDVTLFLLLEVGDAGSGEPARDVLEEKENETLLPYHAMG